MIKTECITITPEKSTELLAQNAHNRPLRAALISLYAEQMKIGNWALNGEPIIIADNGDVLDGQHRLFACIKSGASVQVLITTGIARKTFDTIDTGRARTGSDVLFIEGLSYELAQTCGVASSFCINFEATGTFGTDPRKTHMTTPARRAEWVHQHPNIIRIAEKIHTYGRPGRLIPASTNAFLWFFMEKKKKASTEEFFKGFLSGANLTEKDPRLALRERLIVQKEYRQTWSRYERMGAVIRAWNWYCRDKKATYPNNLFRKLPEAFTLIQVKKASEPLSSARPLASPKRAT